ncbi:MAG: aldehyde dehydrogenase family protein [Pseudomonadota bacterium]
MNAKESLEDAIDAVFAAQQKHQWVQRKTTAKQRIEKLNLLKAAIAAREEEIQTALYKDLRKDANSVSSGEIEDIYHEIDDTIAHLAQWMAPTTIEASPALGDATAKTIYEARGIVLLFGPWNFPFVLVFRPLVQALSAGNCVIVKPNEMAPETSAVTAKIIQDVFQPEEVAVFEGDVSLANALLELPVDHIFFTGSPAVGKIVMRAAAQHLASVTLELGGKNPVVIDRHAGIAEAAQKIAVLRNLNSGQVCLCPENVYVHESQYHEFLAVVKATYEAMFYKDGVLDQDVQGRIVDERNHKRVTGYLDDARAKGAEVVTGGDAIDSSLGIHPTILTNVPDDAIILQEEVFGPILTVFTYSDIGEVYDTLHQQAKPLALYIFSEDESFIEDVLANTTSGGVTINHCVMHYSEPQLPFGGVNASGMGRYHSIHGFRELSHERAVLQME